MINPRNTIAKLVLVIPFVFSSVAFIASDKSIAKQNSSQEHVDLNTKFDTYLKSVYNKVGLIEKGLSFPVFEKAMTGYFNLKNSDNGFQKSIITIVDFQKTSTEKRLWIIDLKNSKVLFNTLVAHGKNTGEDEAINFSDIPNSNMSSLGFYLTGNTYNGKHGLSLILEGKDKGFNSNAKERSIVMHGAEYVREEFIQCHGRLGRSHGCPALPPTLNKEIIEVIKDGTILFIHHPSATYQSVYLDRNKALDQFEKENDYN